MEPLETRSMLSVTSPAAPDLLDLPEPGDAAAEDHGKPLRELEKAAPAAPELPEIPSIGALLSSSASSGGGYGGYGGYAPTTSGIDDIEVNEDAADEIVDLYAAFDDVEDDDDEMFYWVDENTNPDLFDSTNIDGYGGLVLDFAENAFGTANITVSATDTDSNWVDTTFTVTVAAVNDTPTTSGISDANVNEDAANHEVVLEEVFSDVEDSVEELSYDIIGITNTDLFAMAVIDSYHELILDFAENEHGTSQVTVRATDSGGLWVETSFTVTVNAVNDAPDVSNFHAVGGPADYWTFSGTVTDVDDDVEGMVVTFGGVLDGYGYTATVEADETFSMTHEFPGLQNGWATAQTTDGEDQSDLAQYYVLVS